MPTMKAIQVSRAGGEFELVERPIPEPQEGQVHVKVEACGICHSDSMVKEGGPYPITYPRVPGHEVAGVIDAIGKGVHPWIVGQRVGVGWHGGHCFVCHACRRGDFIHCQNEKIAGFSYDGGYAEYMVAPQEALARELGADEYIDTETTDPAQELLRMGGARVVMVTAPSGRVMASTLPGIDSNGQLLVIAAPPDATELYLASLIRNTLSIQGWPSGTAVDSEDALNFSNLRHVRPMIETFPLERASEAYQRMMSNQVRFRAVLTP